MGPSRLRSSLFLGIWTTLLSTLSLVPGVSADDDIQWVRYVTDNGVYWFDNDRQPALYTQEFGDCQGNSAIHLTRFDASLYQDNLTVALHVQGTTDLDDERMMMHLSVFAYGESRFDMPVDPCTIDVPTMCPVRANTTVEVNGMIPLGPSDISGVPSVAYAIPDFEGQAILRIYSVKTKTQVACYVAKMTNGNTFSHPNAVGTILGLFTLVAFISSVAVAVYGENVPDMRTHHAHSVSVFIVFAVFQHIFFSGALSMNWPSVLVAWWSNFAWAAGMIYTDSMQHSISQFINHDYSNISLVGAAPANYNFSHLGGGIDVSTLKKRLNIPLLGGHENLVPSEATHRLQRRFIENTTTGFTWYGELVAPGLPLPGNYSGFAGTLSEIGIPASNAFLTGFLWLLIMAVIVTGVIAGLKLVVEGLARTGRLGTVRLEFFRMHWRRFVGVTILRFLYLSFFAIVTLCLFQFALGGATQSTAVAAVIFCLFSLGMSGCAGYALWFRLRSEQFRRDADRIQIVSKKRGIEIKCESSTFKTTNSGKILTSLPWTNWHFVDPADRPHVHEDTEYTTRFGWLTSRFRRSKWWFFAFWIVYEFGRACFFGGAVGHALVQVFGLLVWEIIAFVLMLMMKPYESNKLNLVMVYFLGFSKVATVALSSAFDTSFALGRIFATVIGVIIIIIQAALTIALLVCIVLGAISSWMSVNRYKDTDNFRPTRLRDARIRHFKHVEVRATDKPAPPSSIALAAAEKDQRPKAPYFSVSSVRRERKIADDSIDVVSLHSLDVQTAPRKQSFDHDSTTTPRDSRAASVHSTASSLPFGAKGWRTNNWSARDLRLSSQEYLPQEYPAGTPRYSMISIDSVYDNQPRLVRTATDLLDIPTPPSASMMSQPAQSRWNRRSASDSLKMRPRSPLVEVGESGLAVRPGTSHKK